MKVTIAKTVAYLIAFIAAASSYGHQVHLLALAHVQPVFGLPGEWITPLTVDALAIVAMMVRTSDTVTDKTKKAALLPLFLAGGLSVAANVAMAENVVQIVVGVWTVAAYILAELFVSKMERRTAEVKQERRKCEPGCTCNRHRKVAEPAKPTRQRRSVIAAR